jgi:hypothetical protein
MTFESYRSHKNTDKFLTAGTILGAVSLFAAAEANATRRDNKKYSTKAKVISNVRESEYSTFFVPGFNGDGTVVAKNLDRHFEQMGTTHYAVHPERGFSLDSIREEWLRARELDGHRPARIYAVSMGALLLSRIFQDEDFRQEFGEVERVVYDSGLSSRSDLSASKKAAIAAGIILPSTHTTGKIYHAINNLMDEHDFGHDPEVLEEEVRERYHSTARARFSSAKSQIWFMHNNDVANMDLSGFGQEVAGGFAYLSSSNDNLVNTDRSVNVYAKSLQQPVEYRIDTGRGYNSHAKGPDHPKSAVDALLNRNHDQYRVRTVRNHVARHVMHKSGLYVPEAA